VPSAQFPEFRVYATAFVKGLNLKERQIDWLHIRESTREHLPNKVSLALRGGHFNHIKTTDVLLAPMWLI